MLLADHAINQTRLATDLAPINALWFYGAGQVQTEACAYTSVYTDCALGQGIARAQQLPILDAAQADSLIILACPQSQNAVFSQCLTLLRRGEINTFDLILTQGERLTLTRKHILSWWQRLWQ